MDKYFICLANSYKHGGRCVAGIEVQVTSGGYNVVKENGRPKWIRPICRNTDAGAIPNEIALTLQLFSIVRMTNVVPCPTGAQSENAFFDELQPIGVSFNESKIQECLVDNSRTTLFFNHGKAVVPDVYNRLGDHSILLIKASDAEIYGDTTYTDYPRYRVRFCYHSHQYDLPITDPWYIHDIRDGKKTPGQKGNLFITCSLGVEHEGWHPKLAACVIEQLAAISNTVEDEALDLVYNVYGCRFTMKYIEGGKTRLGIDAEELNFVPTHDVDMNNYYMCQIPVTKKLFYEVMRRGSDPTNLHYNEDDSCLPANCSITDALLFIYFLNEILGTNFRLPTLDEWEYAAKGGRKTHHYKYSGSNNIDEVAWYEGNSNEKLHPVALKKPNELHLYDMSGNVFEWCTSNKYEEKYSVDENDWYEFWLYKGGCFWAPAEICETNFAFDYDQGGYLGYNSYGFRLCMSCQDLASHHLIDVSQTKNGTYTVEEVRKTHSQAYAKWTPEADAELGRLYELHWSIPQLMNHFGRNEGSIRSRLKKIGKIE